MFKILEMDNINLKYYSKNTHGKLDNPVLSDFNLDIYSGEIAFIIGPSGCGKTSLLRSIAGFCEPNKGQIKIKDKVVFNQSKKINLSPSQRRVGMVFQDFALFPHLNVEKNILFAITEGLPHRATKNNILQCGKMLELTGLEKFKNKFIHEISGGQQQRVAIARALAPSPQILLLDEPFSNLDSKLKFELSREIIKILKKTNTTALIATHDQQEALSLSDKVGVIISGKLMQWDNAYKIYHEPKTANVARFVGEGAFITGIMSKNHVKTSLGNFLIKKEKNNNSTEKTVRVLLRPDDIIHDDQSSLEAKVLRKDFRGADFLYTLELKSGEKILSLVPSHHDHPVNKPIGIKTKIDHVVTFSSEEAVALFGEIL